MTVKLLFLILALIAFALAALNVPSRGLNWIGVGLVLLTVAFMLPLPV
jgi:hypothetical protein